MDIIQAWLAFDLNFVDDILNYFGQIYIFFRKEIKAIYNKKGWHYTVYKIEED